MSETGDGKGKCDCPIHRPAPSAGIAPWYRLLCGVTVNNYNAEPRPNPSTKGTPEHE